MALSWVFRLKLETRPSKLSPVKKNLNPNELGLGDDWLGNFAAFTCPCCQNVFVVSGLHGTRACPRCGRSRATVEGGKDSGGHAWIEWE